MCISRSLPLTAAASKIQQTVAHGCYLFCPTYYGIYHRLNMTENTDKEINAQAERPRANDELISKATSGEYKYGFVSDIDTDIIPAGLTEEIVRLISQRKASRNGCSTSA